jgi:hypothetical protein
MQAHDLQFRSSPFVTPGPAPAVVSAHLLFALLNAPSIEDAKALVERSAQRLEAFEVDICPVKHFPHFD